MLIPRHVAIIMDGNNRWAKKHLLPSVQGHRKGVEAVRRTIKAAQEIGIEYLTLYVFSVDNWKRSEREIKNLMNLLREFLKKSNKELINNNIRLKFIGRKEGLPEDIQKRIGEVTLQTKNNKKLTLVIALNYGGRTEIVDGIKRLIGDLEKGEIKKTQIDEKLFQKYLYAEDVPDPDLFIRTSGEYRLSNYLLWQLSYTELYFTSVLWPDFKKETLLEAIEDFNKRQRRFGGR